MQYNPAFLYPRPCTNRIVMLITHNLGNTDLLRPDQMKHTKGILKVVKIASNVLALDYRMLQVKGQTCFGSPVPPETRDMQSIRVTNAKKKTSSAQMCP